MKKGFGCTRASKNSSESSSVHVELPVLKFFLQMNCIALEEIWAEDVTQDWGKDDSASQLLVMSPQSEGESDFASLGSYVRSSSTSRSSEGSISHSHTSSLDSINSFGSSVSSNVKKCYTDVDRVEAGKWEPGTPWKRRAESALPGAPRKPRVRILVSSLSVGAYRTLFQD